MIDTYQTLIAGVVGFVGVIISILANGFLLENSMGKVSRREENLSFQRLKQS
ncbi:TPA: hypothetical protein NKR24_004723 [Vibrio parahaemolyticus]|nr:hypothetical protein [Vibrio parahaemolyticus]HCH1697038.1 hypothetical protein [Vibrio parahaemolyticus]